MAEASRSGFASRSMTRPQTTNWEVPVRACWRVLLVLAVLVGAGFVPAPSAVAQDSEQGAEQINSTTSPSRSGPAGSSTCGK